MAVIHMALSSSPDPHIQLLTGHLLKSMLKIKHLKTCSPPGLLGLPTTQAFKPHNWASPLILAPVPSSQPSESSQLNALNIAKFCLFLFILIGNTQFPDTLTSFLNTKTAPSQAPCLWSCPSSIQSSRCKVISKNRPITIVCFS